MVGSRRTLSVAAAIAAAGTLFTGLSASSTIAELWVDPAPNARNLTTGPAGSMRGPAVDSEFKVVERDTRGFSITYRVEDAAGREWNVKIGPEAQTEVVSSRILWALGYHQLPSFFVKRWIAIEDGKPHRRGGARFRPADDGLDGQGPWAWRDNPFIGTRPFNGLLVLLMILNSSDLKDDNNEWYELEKGPREGASTWYIVKDLGASLGETGRMEPRRGYIDGFEREPFITGVEGRRVKFGFRGRHQDLLKNITIDDVKWMCARVLKVTDAQWHDAFAAGGYDAATTARYVTRIKQKAQEGLGLP
jgi:hypothetical protein